MARSDGDPSFEEVVAAFIEHGIARSLQNVEDAMTLWQGRDATALQTHSMVMRHAARISVFLEEVAHKSVHNRAGFLREAAIERLITTSQEDALYELPGGTISDDPSTGGSRITPLHAIMASAGSGRVAMATAALPPTIKPTSLMNIARGLENPDKSRIVNALMEEGAVLVHVDARRDGVRVPAHLQGQSKLVLRFGVGLSPAIFDLVVDDQELSGTLTFGGSPFHCVLPWHAVYAAVVEGADKGHVWPEDVPDLTFAGDLSEQSSRDGSSPNDEKDNRDNAVPRATVTTSAVQASGPKKRPSHLRLVD